MTVSLPAATLRPPTGATRMGQPSALRLIHTYEVKTSLMADLPVPGNLTSK